MNIKRLDRCVINIFYLNSFFKSLIHLKNKYTTYYITDYDNFTSLLRSNFNKNFHKTFIVYWYRLELSNRTHSEPADQRSNPGTGDFSSKGNSTKTGILVNLRKRMKMMKMLKLHKFIEIGVKCGFQL